MEVAQFKRPNYEENETKRATKLQKVNHSELDTNHVKLELDEEESKAGSDYDEILGGNFYPTYSSHYDEVLGESGKETCKFPLIPY